MEHTANFLLHFYMSIKNPPTFEFDISRFIFVTKKKTFDLVLTKFSSYILDEFKVEIFSREVKIWPSTSGFEPSPPT